MSSSPPQLHLSLPPNTTSFKRSFEQFGFDLESPGSTVTHSREIIHGSSSTASGESSSTMSPDGDQNRRKRARSASSLSSPEDRSSDASSSTLSSFDSDPDSPHSSQAAARRHLLLDLGLGRGLGSSVALGLSMASAELQLGIPEPPPRIPTPELLETDDVEMPDIDMHFSRREEHEDEEPTSSAEHVRRSVDRFNAFDRHISVLRSSSPPIIPLPASLSSRQASQSPPILPPLPLVDFGLDAEDDEDDDPDHIPSTAATNTTTSTPPRLDLNLPSTSSLSSRPSSPHLATDETSSTQFRERLDSAIDGLGGGDLQIPPTYSASPPEQRPDDNSHESIPDSLANANGSASTHRSQPLVETPLFEWPPSTLDWNMALGPPADRNAGTSADTARSPQLPPYSPWRPPVRPAVNATAATDTTTADIRRFIGRAYSPPSPIRLYPRPASLAAPLSVPATSASLDADLVGAYLDLQQSSTNRAWESALDRARTLHRERERERERDRERDRLRERDLEHERERERQRVREEEAEREEEHPWSLDSFWEPRASRRAWEAPTSRAGRELAHNERELDLESMRRRAAQRQIHRSQDRERERQRDDERGQPSVSRAARYLESGLVDPREASRPMLDSSAPARDRQLRAPSDTSNPFTVSWGSRRVLRAGDEEDGFAHPGTRRSRSRSQSRDGSTLDWLAHMVPDEGPTLHEWISEARPSRSANPRAGASGSGTYDEREELDHSQRSGESPSSYAVWRARSSGTWQPRLAVSPQSTAQPARTPAHARAQSIPTSSLSSFSSMTGQPAVHRLRSRPPRTAGVGSANSLVAENAAALRRREARAELMERLNHTMSVDISDPESDWDSPMTRRARDPPPMVDRDDEMDSDEESHTAPLPRRVAEAIEMIEARPPPRLIRYRRPSDTTSPLPPRLSSSSLRSRSSAGRGAFEQDAEEQTNASSSGLNTRRPPSIRRTIPLLRPHPISGEISPPPPPSASVNRRHVSWEAPSRDTGVSSTYQYLSALSHGFDSQSLSISDLAHTIASNSNSEALRSSPSSPWGDHESPFSTLFARTAGASSSRHSPHNTRSQAMPGGYPDDTMEAEDSGIPSLPPPDLGGDFERTEDMLRSANTGGTRASSAMDNPISESPISNIRPPPSHNPYTGPFRLTMQRREEYSRQRLAASQRRIPDPPSIPPLHFGAEFDNPPSLTPPEERSDSRFNWLDYVSPHRPVSYQEPMSRNEFSSNARLADSERRLFHYRGPSQGSPGQSSDGDPRRFFPSRPMATSSSHVHRDPEESRSHRYSATDMHNVLARQARLAGSRLAPDLPSPHPDDIDGLDIRHEGMSTSRAQRLISRFHEQAAAEAREPSSSTPPWAALPPTRRSDAIRTDSEARRRRLAATRNLTHDVEPLQLRHRVFREPSLHALFGGRMRRRALGDYMRDEDFDASYETLLSLGGMIGDAKPKATPDHVVAGLENATYKEWATAESDQRCPICLDDYEPSDPVMKLGDCRHWLHKECLEQWLKGASTCPVCRKDVKGKGRRTNHPHHHHAHGPSRRRDGDGPEGPGGPSTSGGGDIPPVNWLTFLRE